jgi:hypothetical protein
MTLFFVLSGFVIHYNYAASIERDGARGIANFFVARFARLYPLYIVVIAGTLVMSFCPCRNDHRDRAAALGNVRPGQRDHSLEHHHAVPHGVRLRAIHGGHHLLLRAISERHHPRVVVLADDGVRRG